MQQFHEAKCIIVGIQETRHRHLVGLCKPLVPCAWASSITSRARMGYSYGFSHCLPIHPQGPCITKDHIRIVQSSPNLLIVKINLISWKCVIVTGRAHTQEDLDMKQLHTGMKSQQLLPAKQQDGPFSSAVMPMPMLETALHQLSEIMYQPRKTKQVKFFTTGCCTNNLKLPATFAESHPGPVHKHLPFSRWSARDED